MTIPVTTSAVLNAAMKPPRAVGTADLQRPAAGGRREVPRERLRRRPRAAAGRPRPAPCRRRRAHADASRRSRPAMRRTSSWRAAPVDAPLERFVDERHRQPHPLLVALVQRLVQRARGGPVDHDPGEDQHDHHDRRQHRGEADRERPSRHHGVRVSRGRQAIPGRRHRLDQPGRARIVVELAPQVCDVDVDDALVDLVRPPSHDVEQLLSAQHRSRRSASAASSDDSPGVNRPLSPVRQRVAPRARVEQQPSPAEAQDRRRSVGRSTRGFAAGSPPPAP